MKKSTFLMVALLTLALSGVASAGQSSKDKEMKFTGDIVAVDTKTHTFTVRNMDKGKTEEMKFYVGVEANLTIDGEPKMLSELEKDDWTTVTYTTKLSQNIPMHVQKHKQWLPGAPQFEGMVVAVDIKDHTFIVKHEEKGVAKEMKFHVEPGTKVIINGERKLLSELEKGDAVTVAYTGSESTAMATHVKHKKATD